MVIRRCVFLMAKRGRPKKVLKDTEIPLMVRDNEFDSLKYKLNVVGYQMHLDVKKRERLETGLKQLHEIAFNERLPDTTAKALAIKLGGNI